MKNKWIHTGYNQADKTTPWQSTKPYRTEQLGMATPIFLLLLSLVWVVGSYFLYIANHKSPALSFPGIAQDSQQNLALNQNPNSAQSHDHQESADTKLPTAGGVVIQQEGLSSKLTLIDSPSFEFVQSSFTYQSPLDENLLGNMQTLAVYLQENKDTWLDITGWYEKTEANFSAFPNLGMARANQVKQLLIEKGAPSTQLKLLSGVIGDSLSKQEKTHSDRIEFKLYRPQESELAKQELAMKKLVENIKTKSLALYFDTNQAQIDLTSEERIALLDMVRYMDAYPSSTLLVLGHTDNTGETLNNIVLGQARAKRIASFLVKNGVSAERVVASSLGELKPKASNNTEQGRKQNRRVEVMVVDAPNG